MPEYVLRGVRVQFPHEAYDVQAKARRGQEQKSAPQSVAAQAQVAATQALQQQLNQQQQRKDPDLLQIIYCSRTHWQLQQVAQELDKTAYSGVKKTVFGSRNQMCVNSAVKHLSGAVQAAACDKVVRTNDCDYWRYHAMGPKVAQMANIADIEDLVHVGMAKHVCPFFSTRELAATAEIIFMPYNYVTQELANMSDMLRNAVLIMDEAHNVENACQDTASFDLTSGHAALCMKEAASLLDTLKSQEARGAQFRDAGRGGFPSRNEGIGTLQSLRSLIERLESKIAAQCDPQKWPQGNTQRADAALKLFAELRVNEDSVDMLIAGLKGLQQHSTAEVTGAATARLPGTAAVLRAVCTLFDRKEFDGQQRAAHLDAASGHVVDESAPTHMSTAAAREAARAAHAATLACYRVHFHIQGAERGSVAGAPCMSFWCMSAGVVMRRLQAAGVRTMLLTSGTLSPLAATAEELAVPVPVRLENPHVVPREQVMCAVISKGPGGTLLNGSYANRDSAAYKRDLGAALVAIAAAVPHGMLLFFPSYAAMKAMLDAWQAWPAGTSLWRQLEAAKPIFQEPRGGGGDLARVIEGFRAAVASSRRGALLFAVCQGRTSEGIDFSDAEGRCVVLAGLPFAPAKDARVLCKRQVLDERKRSGAGSMTGQHWYTLSAMRVANQALGRVIRHRHDYGAILLADERFARPDMRQGISFWAREFLTVRDAFGNMQGDLDTFFRTNDKNMPAPAPRAIASGAAGDGKAALFGKSAGGTAGANAAPAAAAGRRAFVPPKAGKAPAKAGQAEHGGSSLKALESSMHVASARDVIGPGKTDATSQMSAQDGGTQSREVTQRPAMRRHNGTASQPLASVQNTAEQHAGGAFGASQAAAVDAAATRGAAAQAPAGISEAQAEGSVEFKEFLLELRTKLPKPQYKQLKEAIRAYSADKQMRPLATAVAECLPQTPEAAALVCRFGRYVPRSDRNTFHRIVVAQQKAQTAAQDAAVARHQSSTAGATVQASARGGLNSVQQGVAHGSVEQQAAARLAAAKRAKAQAPGASKAARLQGATAVDARHQSSAAAQAHSAKPHIGAAHSIATRQPIAAAAHVPAQNTGAHGTTKVSRQPLAAAAHTSGAHRPAAKQGRSAQPVAGGQYTCAKCKCVRGGEGAADLPRAAACGHTVCGVCWTTARLKGGMHAARMRCPLCGAPQGSTRGDL